MSQMTNQRDTEPWHGLPPEVADAIEPELPAATRAILEAIADEVPEYARPLEGAFGRGVRVGVDEALRQFLALIRDPRSGREPGREVYVGLGRGELRQGRTLDSLQAAYRVGARVAWRQLAAAGRRAGLDAETISLLGEAIFAYINELSADSVEGYTRAQAELEGERQPRRRQLIALLLREPPADEADLRAAAEAAGWRPPRSVAALACAEADLGRIAPRLPADSLAATFGAAGCALIPDPAGPGRLRELQATTAGMSAALGHEVAPAGLLRSWSLARTALRAVEAGALERMTPGDGGPGPRSGLVLAEHWLPQLLLFDNPATVELIAARRLEPLEGLTPKARERMRETALAFVQHRGNAPEMARAMHVHPQTARYRLARLRELFGEQLDDPEARLELELALRASA